MKNKFFKWKMEISDFEKLKAENESLERNPKRLALYTRMAKSPLYYVVSIGGWSVKRTIAALIPFTFLLVTREYQYAFVAMGLALYYSYGSATMDDTLIRFHIWKRLRSNGMDRVVSITQPVLALARYLNDSGTGDRSIIRYVKTRRNLRLAGRLLVSAALASFAIFAFSISLLILRDFGVVTVTNPSLIVSLAFVSLYCIFGILYGMVGFAIFARIKLDSLRPAYIHSEDLGLLRPSKAEERARID